MVFPTLLLFGKEPLPFLKKKASITQTCNTSWYKKPVFNKQNFWYSIKLRNFKIWNYLFDF